MFIFNDHKDYEGKHAFLSPSGKTWLNWDKETLITRFYNHYAKDIGTIVHEVAKDCIRSRMKLNKGDKHLIELMLYKNYIPKKAYVSEDIIENLANFVNDAIGFRMQSEVVLFYSNFVFGTADAIVFDPETMTLRIHDLKNGKEKVVTFDQLLIYDAIFCLEYKVDPYKLKGGILLRLYQFGEVGEYKAEPEEIKEIMDIIVESNKELTFTKERG